MATKLPGIPLYKVTDFSWGRGPDHRVEVGCVELSDLAGHGRTPGAPWFTRIYPDACDKGFHVHSPRTGRTLLFTLQDTVEGDEEVGAWVFRNDETDIHITVWND